MKLINRLILTNAMSKHAEKLAKFINKAGFLAHAYDIGAVGITIEDKTLYVYDPSTVEDYAAKYGPDCKLSYDQYEMRLMINGTENYIKLSNFNMMLSGVLYGLGFYYRCVGHFKDNYYTCYKNMWVSINSHDENGIPTHVLDANFNPANNVQVLDIKNEGCKIVPYKHIQLSNIGDKFTILSNGFIVDGKYSLNSGSFLFKFVNEKNELVAMLQDPLSDNNLSLHSASQVIKLDIDIRDYQVYTNHVKVNAEKLQGAFGARVYYYKSTFFGFNGSDYIELEAVPNSARTKPTKCIIA